MLELLLALALTLGASAGNYTNQAIDPPENQGGGGNFADPPDNTGGGGSAVDPPDTTGGGG